jgi:tripartite-type tricarboxylate transporter receptor subunit TctC
MGWRFAMCIAGKGMALVSVAAWALAVAGFSEATQPVQDFPNRPVRMIVPFAPGGGSDIVARILAEGLAERWKQSVVVDNRPGAGSTVGAAIAARSPADGYTVLVTSSAIAFSPSLYKPLPYDTNRDFAAISLIARQPSILAVATAVPTKSVKELIGLAREHPGKLTFGSAGIGSATHLGAELFRYSARIDMTHVPYKSAGLAMTALLGNEVQVLLTNTATVLPHLKAARVRALATSGRTRNALVPDLPTIAESALPGFEYDTWYAMLAPRGIASGVVQRFSTDSADVLNAPRLAARFLGQGIEIVASTPDALAHFLRSEIAKWGQVIRAAGVS